MRRLIALGLALSLSATAGCATSENDGPSFRWTATDPVSHAIFSASGTPYWAVGGASPNYVAEAQLGFETQPQHEYDIPFVNPNLYISVWGPEANRYPTDATIHFPATGLDTLHVTLHTPYVDYLADSGKVTFRAGANGATADFTFWTTRADPDELYPARLKVVGSFHIAD